MKGAQKRKLNQFLQLLKTNITPEQYAEAYSTGGIGYDPETDRWVCQIGPVELVAVDAGLNNNDTH